MKKYLLIALCLVGFSSSASANVESNLTLQSIKQSIVVIFEVNKPRPIKF